MDVQCQQKGDQAMADCDYGHPLKKAGTGHLYARTICPPRPAPNPRTATQRALAIRNAEIVRLKIEGLTFRAIGERLNINVASAYRGYTEAMTRVGMADIEAYRTQQLARLASEREAVLEVLQNRHVVISYGEVMTEDGQPIMDDAPVLAAVDRLLKIDEREARLLGLDAKAEQIFTGTLRYEIVGVPDDNEGLGGPDD
jgi:hypothetical protein